MENPQEKQETPKEETMESSEEEKIVEENYPNLDFNVGLKPATMDDIFPGGFGNFEL